MTSLDKLQRAWLGKDAEVAQADIVDYVCEIGPGNGMVIVWFYDNPDDKPVIFKLTSDTDFTTLLSTLKHNPIEEDQAYSGKVYFDKNRDILHRTILETPRGYMFSVTALGFNPMVAPAMSRVLIDLGKDHTDLTSDMISSDVGSIKGVFDSWDDPEPTKEACSLYHKTGTRQGLPQPDNMPAPKPYKSDAQEIKEARDGGSSTPDRATRRTHTSSVTKSPVVPEALAVPKSPVVPEAPAESRPDFTIDDQGRRVYRYDYDFQKEGSDKWGPNPLGPTLTPRGWKYGDPIKIDRTQALAIRRYLTMNDAEVRRLPPGEQKIHRRLSESWIPEYKIVEFVDWYTEVYGSTKNPIPPLVEDVPLDSESLLDESARLTASMDFLDEVPDTPRNLGPWGGGMGGMSGGMQQQQQQPQKRSLSDTLLGIVNDVLDSYNDNSSPPPPSRGFGGGMSGRPFN